MTYNQAVEVIKNAQNYSMIEIREAEQTIDEMVDKAESWDDGRDKIYSKISHITMNTEPNKIKPGFVSGMYHALDLLDEDAPDD